MVLLLVVLLVVVSLVVLVPPVRPGVDVVVVGFLGGDLLSGERVGVLRVGERAEGKP